MHALPSLLRPLLPLLTLPLLLVLASPGCALTQPKRFTVRESSLNWVEIVYMGTNQPASTARISLIGNGNIQMRSGTSPRVLDDFAADTAHPNWNDYRQQEVQLPAAEMRQIFQSLVNRGAYDPEPKRAPDDPLLPMARLNGRLDGDLFFRHTTEPGLIEVVSSLMTLIEHAGKNPPLDLR